MHWHSMSIEEVLRKFNVNAEEGLSNKKSRTGKGNTENILDAKKKLHFKKILSQFADFMIIVLILQPYLFFSFIL